MENKFWLPLIVAVAVVLGILLGTRLNYPNSPLAMQEANLREQKLKQLINYIDYEYVDVVNTDSLLDLTIQDLLHKLDPHSSYISLEDVQATSENLQGNFEGIGIEFTTVQDSLTVLRVIDNGPSKKAGLLGGDRILAVDTDTIVGKKMRNSDYIKLLKGSAGSKVTVYIYRPFENAFKTIEIIRGKIPLPSVEVAQMINNKVGLIKINRFAETTYDEFYNSLLHLKKEGMEDLILDLRDNPGGLLYTANKIADEFLDKEQLIVFTEDRKGQKDYTFASKKGEFQQGGIVVLINENSASASEIIAGALQDNDRAIIVGRRSFGKGLVQEEMELKDGSKVRLTTSRYFTPTGRSIQKPYGADYADYQRDAEERYYSGELFEEDSIKVNNQEEFTTPGGKTVYGGGGIVPDVFVPVDTSSIGILFHVYGISRMDNYAFNLIDAHRKEYIEWEKDVFIKEFEVTEEMMDDFLSIGKGAHAQLADKDLHFIKIRLKALIGRNLFGSEAYYSVMSKEDPMVKKGLELHTEVE